MNDTSGELSQEAKKLIGEICYGAFQAMRQEARRVGSTDETTAKAGSDYIQSRLVDCTKEVSDYCMTSFLMVAVQKTMEAMKAAIDCIRKQE